MEVVPSPDGRQFALQLWQHIWVVDSAGGEARRITNPIEPPDQHWFPRWSPDGRYIVFSSLRRDAGLLIVPVSGGEPRRLTDGPYDWWPSWSPDGETIAFCPLIIGGIWTIPASGGMAHRLTPDTLDAGNPAWSPDGRWIAFNSGGRLHVVSADGASIRQLTTGPNDKAPSWSPSGRDLFFLSRRSDRLQVWFVSADGGEPRRLTNDEDVNEYAPQWLPGRNLLVYSAGGKIRTVDPTTGTRDSIPFQARLTLPRVVYARRSPSIMAPGARVQVRGISRLAPSPDGSRLVFAALGDLWLREADGRVRQLTTGSASDKDPAWSQDELRLAFVSNEKGDYQVFTLDLGSGARRCVTSGSGYATAPVWHPSGDSIAFVFSTAPNRGRLSLKIVATQGGPSHELARTQAMDLRPLLWTTDAGLLYAELAYRTGEGGLVTRIQRFSGGVPEPFIADWPNAQLDFLAVSPDVRQLAFVKQGELRVRVLSSDSAERIVRGPAAFFPAWAGNRQVVYLSGGEVRRFDMASETDRRLSLDLSYTVPRPHAKLLLRNARLLTPEPREGLWDLLLGEGMIQSIRPAGHGPVADSIVDLAGRTVIPGLIDAHVHIFRGVFPHEGVLYWGITSVGDAGSEGHETVELSEAIESGRQDGPRIFPAGGFFVKGKMNAFPQFLRVDTLTQLSRYIDHLVGLGATHVKAYDRWDPWLQAATVRIAHEHGLPVLSHSLGPAVVAAGLDRKEHAFYESTTGEATLKFRQDVIAILRQAGVTLTPTLVWAYVETPDGRARLRSSLSDSTVSGFLLPSKLAFLTRQLEQASPTTAGWTSETLKAMRANVAASAAAGVPLAAGTDQPDALLALHWELELLVEAGLTPLEALKAATRGAAAALGVSDRLGVIAEGAVADLVVLNSDPLQDIRNTRRIWAVIKQGQIVDREALLMQARKRHVIR